MHLSTALFVKKSFYYLSPRSNVNSDDDSDREEINIAAFAHFLIVV